MKVRGSSTLLVVLLAAASVLGLAAAPAARAQGDSLGAGYSEQQDEARRAVQQGRHVPLLQVIEAIRKATPGRQLDAGLETGADGRAVYRVRWAAMDGRRIDYLVDAQTGAILQAQGR